MVNRILPKIGFALLSLAVPAVAQTVHTFSFSPISITDTTGSGAFTLIDGLQPDCAIGFCGSVQVRWDGASNPWWGLISPQQDPGDPNGWPFPNGGYNPENTVTPDPGQLVWDNNGCGENVVGCTGHKDTTISFVNYGNGIVISVHDEYIVRQHRCYRYCRPPQDYFQNGFWWYNRTEENGGKGTAMYTPQ